ncbi:hypothetical protein [Methylorubrum thiocyanatum]
MIGAALYQAGQAKGAHDAFALQSARALRAEKDRAAAARRVTESLALQATRDIAAEQASNAKLKDLLDHAEKRLDAARECLPRDLSRRLRDL